VLFPCARQHTIHAGNAGRIRARAIVPGANSPCTDAAEEILFRRGILVVPGFVSNSGGVLGGTMDFAGIPAIMIEEFMDKRMGARIASLLAAARRQGVAVREVAVPLALGRAARIQLREQSPNWTARLFRVGLALHRHGLVPRALTGAASRGYFNRLFDSYAE
jgi:glutamate dehydrogenase (NAD(P)+)